MVGVPLMKCSPVVWNCILEFELKDQGEASDHRTDCVRHIVRECRHIVFTLAYCQLGEEVGDGVEGGVGGEEVGDGGGSKNTSWSVSISPLHPELQKINFPQSNYANQLWYHLLASPEEPFVSHWLNHHGFSKSNHLLYTFFLVTSRLFLDSVRTLSGLFLDLFSTFSRLFLDFFWTFL